MPKILLTDSWAMKLGKTKHPGFQSCHVSKKGRLAVLPTYIWYHKTQTNNWVFHYAQGWMIGLWWTTSPPNRRRRRRVRLPRLQALEVPRLRHRLQQDTFGQPVEQPCVALMFWRTVLTPPQNVLPKTCSCYGCKHAGKNQLLLLMLLFWFFPLMCCLHILSGVPTKSF